MKKLFLISFVLFLCSCTTVKNISYFQDLNDGEIMAMTPVRVIKVQPDDKISIVVNSKDPVLMQLVNLPTVQQSVVGTVSGTSRDVSSYSVNKAGEIDFPVLGKIKVSGLTREEIATLIKDRLINEEVVKDPVVTVEFANLAVSVLGEVTKPGRYSIVNDKMTILDALSMAGDLTIYGMRDKVTVMRERDGKQITYKLNMMDTESLFKSPAYYLCQNDVIYVEPNDVRARQSTVNGNNLRSTSFWISVTSLLATVINIIL